MSGTLRIEGLWVEGRDSTRQWFPIVQDVSVEVKRGEIVALIGESGAGKTTVALSALGYYRPGTRPVRGHVYLDDTDLLDRSSEELRDIRGRQVAYVAQSASAALNPRIPLGSQIVEGLLVHGIKQADAGHDRMIELMDLMHLPHPNEIAQRYPYQISGGQRQRVMVAMAMACDPQFLILDEPTTALDVTTQIEVLKAIGDVIRQKGSGAIYVSHDLAVVAQVADRIIVMNDGKMVESAETEEMLRNPREPYTGELLDAVRTIPKNFQHLHGSQKPKESDRETLFALNDIRASYEKDSWLHRVPEERQALRSVSLSIKPKEVVALVGESGSGKSTLARVMAGLMTPLSGEIMYSEEPLAQSVRMRGLEQLRKIQIVFQSPDLTLNPSQSIEKAIGRPLSLYFGLKGEQRRNRVIELLGLVELPAEYADRYPAELSGGEKQRVALARAFGAEPEVIICDEVLSALDNLVARRILELLKDLKDRLDVAYLFISHDLATVASIADRVMVMYAGRVCEEGPTEEVFSPPHHPYTALLISSVPELRHDWLSDVLESRGTQDDLGSIAFPVDRGCAFRTRCPLVVEGLCESVSPPALALGEHGQNIVYCHRNIEALTAAAEE
jgi:peptide/nickel transport system ATP-binding protein